MELNARRGSDPVVDFHAHVTPVRFQQAIARSGEWHGLDASTGELEVEGFRRPVERRLADMDADGIDMQAVSPNAGFYQYGREPESTATIARECNDEIAEMCAAHPDRFVGLGTLPMQDTPLAVRELERIMTQLGFAGVMVGDHVDGRTWDEPAFAPFWKAVEDLRALVFFHQGSGTVVSNRISRYHLDNSVGNQTERALTFGALVGGGVIDRHPNLKLVLGHAGGFTAFASARMDRAWEAGRELTEEGVDPAIALGGARARNEAETPKPPSDYLRAFYYDCCTYTPGTLRFLVDTVGADRVVLGSDYPAPMMIPDPVRWVRGLDVLSYEEQRAILATNARALLTRSTR
jgi:aminocarboxymuconate-semialdehyde decarboxylase